MNEDAWGRRRRMGVWVNVSAQVLVFLGLLVMVNLISWKSFRRIDVTSRRAFGLSTATEDALRRMSYDLEIWLTSIEYSFTQDKSLRVAWRRTADLLEEFSRRSARIKVRIVTEGDQREFTRMQRHWSVVSSNTLYLLATLGPERTNKKSIDLYELYQGNPSTGEIGSYRGEPVLAQAIAELAAETKRVVYESQGHQELLTGDPRALSTLAAYLGSNEGIEFRPFRSQDKKDVPGDADLLMVMGPAQPFQPEEIELFLRHLDRGGGMFVALRPGVAAGLEGFLEECGVRPGKDLVHDPAQSLSGRPTDLVVSQFSLHDINRGMQNAAILFPECGTVSPVEKKDPAWRIQDLIRSGPNSWAETWPPAPGVRPKPDPGERVGHLPLIVAVEKPAGKPRDGKHTKARLLVWGGVIPLANPVLSPGGIARELEVLYAVNNFRWVMARETLEIQPLKVSMKPLEMSPAALEKVRWVTLGLFPAVGVLLGLGVWFLRRK